MKGLKKIFIVLGILLALFISAGIIISTLYEEEVKAYAIKQINNSIATKITVNDVSFSVLKKFPYASLEFKTVTIEEAVNDSKKGTLFSAKSVFLQFSLMSLFSENYTIKKIQVTDGIVNLHTDKKGNNNYHFWKESQDPTSSDLTIELQEVLFNDVTFYYLNEYQKIDLAVKATDLSFSGNFSSDDYTLNTQANLYIHQIISSEQSLIKNKTIEINTALAVNQKIASYQITNGEIILEELHFDIAGNIQNQEEGITLNITSKGKDLEIASLVSLLPPEQKTFLNAYQAKGNITYHSTITGELSAKKAPSFTANFSIDNGEVIENSSDYALNNIHLAGTLTNGNENSLRSSQLVLETFDADFGAGHITGKYAIDNFLDPYIKINSTANIDLATAKDFFKLDTFEIATGILDLNLQYEGKIKNLNNITSEELQRLNARGTAQISNASFKLVAGNNTFKDIQGSFNFNNNIIEIETLDVSVNNSRANLKGKFQNLLAFLFIENQNLNISASVHAPVLNLDDLLLKNKTTSSAYAIHLPDNIKFHFKTQIDTFQFRKFNATHFSGNIYLNKKILTGKDIQFNSMEGSISGELAIDANQPNKILITCNAHLHQINIQQAFTQFENFGQNYLLENNIRGIATSDVTFASVWDKQLKINPNKIYVLANLSIDKGELIDFEPIMAMSNFIQVEELNRIHFSTLQTEIEIKNQTIYIPKTNINSSAIDLTLSGTHTFDNHINYHFKLLLNDVLWGKATNQKKENSEFGYIEEDGLGKTSLFLKMTGTRDDYKITYDNKERKEKWQTDIKEEKVTLKKILKEEFGWFKKDTTINDTNKPLQKDPFEFEWEEEEKNDTESTDKNKPDSTNKKKKNGFFDKITQPNEDELEEEGDF